jgi:glucan-binding YG repeat protein
MQRIRETLAKPNDNLSRIEMRALKGEITWEELITSEGIQLSQQANQVFIIREAMRDGIQAGEIYLHDHATTDSFLPPQISEDNQERIQIKIKKKKKTSETHKAPKNRASAKTAERYPPRKTPPRENRRKRESRKSPPENHRERIQRKAKAKATCKRVS